MEIKKQNVIDVKNNWDEMAEKSKIYINNFSEKKKLEIVESEKKYIGLAFISDMHLGGIGVDYDRAKEDAQIIANTDNAYAILGGDGIDNFVNIKIAVAMRDSITTPEDQFKLLDYYLGLFDNHILSMISGNHEEWSYNLIGIDTLGMLAKQKKILYSRDEFFITIKLNGIPYKIYMRHKYRFNSSFNLTHSVKQMWRMGEYDFDIGVIGHHHVADLETFFARKQKKFAIRTGSYKISDPFSRKVGFNSANSTFPFIILSPNKKEEMIMIDNLKQGCSVLKIMNQELEEKEKLKKILTTAKKTKSIKHKTNKKTTRSKK